MALKHAHFVDRLEHPTLSKSVGQGRVAFANFDKFYGEPVKGFMFYRADWRNESVMTPIK